MKSTRSLRSAAALLVCAFVSFGCSSKSEPASVAAKTPTPTPVTSETIRSAEQAGAARSNPQSPAQPAQPAPPTAAGSAARVLRFSGIPNQNTTELAEKYRPLAKYLSEKLGVPVEYVPSVDYNASVDGFKNGDLQLCWFGGFTGVQARQAVPGARVIACGPRDKKFRTYFVAHASLGLSKSAEFPLGIRGKTFTFGSAQSTSGRLMPEAFIRKFAQQSPKEFFGAEPSFSGGHDKTLALVAAGTFQCGAVDYTVYEKLVKEGKVDPAVVQVIWESPEYFDYQFTAHPALESTYGSGFTEKLQQVLTSVAPADWSVFAAMDRSDAGLVTCTNADFETLRKTAVDIGLVR